jgi:hypothetical protein
LQACCGAIDKLNATSSGSGHAGLDIFGLPEVFKESFRLLPHDAEIFRAGHKFWSNNYSISDVVAGL